MILGTGFLDRHAHSLVEYYGQQTRSCEGLLSLGDGVERIQNSQCSRSATVRNALPKEMSRQWPKYSFDFNHNALLDWIESNTALQDDAWH